MLRGLFKDTQSIQRDEFEIYWSRKVKNFHYLFDDLHTYTNNMLEVISRKSEEWPWTNFTNIGMFCSQPRHLFVWHIGRFSKTEIFQILWGNWFGQMCKNKWIRMFNISNISFSCCPTVGDLGQYFVSHHISHSNVLTQHETYGPFLWDLFHKQNISIMEYFEISLKQMALISNLTRSIDGPLFSGLDIFRNLV